MTQAKRGKKEGRDQARKLKKNIIKERGCVCEICGSTILIQIHHYNNDRRVNTRKNAMLLCDDCHKWGHSIDTRVTDYSEPPTIYLRS